MTTRETIARALRQLARRDPVTAVEAVHELASGALPSVPFAEAIADVLIDSRHPGDEPNAFEAALFDHLHTLAPASDSQRLRVFYNGSSRPILNGCLKAEAQLLEGRTRLEHRLRLDYVGAGAEVTFGHVLEDAMIRGSRWSRQAWETLIASSAPVRTAATRLVWTATSDRDQVHFRVSPEGERLDVGDEPFEPDEEATISLCHTLDFDEAEIEAWGRLFGDYDVIALFAQFDRTVASPPDSWLQRDAVPLHRGVAHTPTYAHFLHEGWLPRSKGSRSYFDRALDGGVVATVSWHPSDERAHLIELYFATTAGQPLLIGAVPPSAYSEALLTLSELDAAGN